MISPKDAQEARSKKLKPILGDLEKSIDEYLSNNEPNYQVEYWYDLTGLSYEVRNELVRLYSALWDVRISCNQIDGDSLVLKAKL
jgi:hypothetical protein